MDATTDERIKEEQAKIAELEKEYNKLSSKNDKSYIPLMNTIRHQIADHEKELRKCTWLWGILDVDSNPH